MTAEGRQRVQSSSQGTQLFSIPDGLGQYPLKTMASHQCVFSALTMDSCNVFLMRWQQVQRHQVPWRVFLSGWLWSVSVRAHLALSSAFHFHSTSIFVFLIFYFFFLNKMPGTDRLVFFSSEVELTTGLCVSHWGCSCMSWSCVWTGAEDCFQSAKQQTGIWLFGLGSSWIWSCWSL